MQNIFLQLGAEDGGSAIEGGIWSLVDKINPLQMPHDTFVKIDDINNKTDIVEVYATIFVNRQSQKQIVIGAGGKILKNIGEQSRIDIEEYLYKKVFLKTWVKVKKNWNTDSNFIQSLVVGNNYESN